MLVVDSVQDEFGKFAAINVVSLAELYGGKIGAAFDGQHPRDIFKNQFAVMAVIDFSYND